MNNEQMQVFNSEQFGQVRIVMVNDEPWFVAADVCKALELEQVSHVMNRLDEDEGGVFEIPHPQNPLKTIKANVINEPGLYSLVLASRKPEAKTFKRWITHEVIPAIRKHGGYLTPQKVEEILTDPDTIIKLATDLKAEREKRRHLEQQVALDAPKVEFAEKLAQAPNLYPISFLAKFLNANGYATGEKRLFKQLREDGYLGKTGAYYNQPLQRYCDSGMMAVQMAKFQINGADVFKQTPRITGKGLRYFYEHYCCEEGCTEEEFQDALSRVESDNVVTLPRNII